MVTIKLLFMIFSHVPCGEAEDKRVEVRPKAAVEASRRFCVSDSASDGGRPTLGGWWGR